MQSPLARHSASPAEIAERLAAERRGVPFLVYRDGGGEQVIRELDAEAVRLTVGRRDGCDVQLAWDVKVSRLHAELVRSGEEWTLSDDGLSHNGTRVGDELLRGRRRLRDGDLIEFGGTVVAYRDPRGDGSMETETLDSRRGLPALSDADRRLLSALCRPLLASTLAAPATNAAVAEELHVSLGAVKSRLHVLFERFSLDQLPQNQKRAALAATAMRAGLVEDQPPARR